MVVAAAGSSSGTGTPAGGSTPPPASQPPAGNAGPEISSRSPNDQATGVATTSAIAVVFTVALEPTSVSDDSLLVQEQGARVDGAVTYQDVSKTLTFTPASTFDPETVYEVSVASTLEDREGNTFLGETWHFTTGGPFNLGPTSQITIDQCMDDQDKIMLTLVNDARAVERTCGSDTFPARDALAWNCRLEEAAQGHSTAMATHDFHAHVSPVDGTDPGDRIRATGYLPQAWAENIAAGYADEGAVMAGWLDSPGHCANVMSNAVSEMGAGMAENGDSEFRSYWTQKFAHPQN